MEPVAMPTVDCGRLNQQIACLSTEATSIARSTTADGQMGESADSNARVLPTGGVPQDSRAAGPDAPDNATRMAATIRTT
jgi:hypothetical protein